MAADRRSSVESFFDVAAFQDVPLCGRMSPDSGEAIGLQLERNRIAASAFLDAEKLLNVMSDLVGDHVCLREIAGGAESIAHRVEESEVEIDLLVDGTVERSGCCLSKSARRWDRIAKENELRVAIARSPRIF